MKFIKLMFISIFLLFVFNLVFGETLFVGENECKNVIIKNRLIEKTAIKIWEKEDSENSPLEMPDKIIKNKDKLFIITHPSAIVVYDTSGNYLNEYYKKGKGPGEFQLLKDIAIENSFLYCLDKDKRAISKFNTDFVLLWEKKLPKEITNISPENIAVSDNYIYISGFAIAPNKKEGNYLVYKMNQNLEVVDKYFKLNDSFFKKVSIFKRKKLIFENMLKTANVIAVKDSIIVMGMLSGENVLYGYDMLNKRFIFKVIDKNNKNKFKIKKDLVGYEVESYFYITGIQLTDNYIVTSESAGDLNSFDSKSLYRYNHISLYSKTGQYLFSVFKGIPDNGKTHNFNYHGDKAFLDDTNGDLIIYNTKLDDNYLVKLKIKLTNS